MKRPQKPHYRRLSGHFSIFSRTTFAWFTSKDEVTNRLTATADYGVTLVEDFKPPEDMTPGQTVNKDVSVVNTGAIDAFVRASLSEKMSMSRLSSIAYTTPAADDKVVYKKTDGTVVTKASTEAKADDETKLYDLKKFTAAIPDLDSETTVDDVYVFLDPQESQDATGAIKANEVTTLMAGGQVVVAESKAVAPDAIAVRSGDDINGATKFDIIYNVSSTGTHDGIKVVYDSTGTGSKYYEVEKNSDGLYVKKTPATPVDFTGETYTVSVDTLARDYSGAAQYKPAETGLYIFKRNDTPKYSGFYYDKSTSKFYALETEDNNSSAYIKDINVGYTDGVVTTVTGIKLRTKETGIDNDKGTWKLEFVKYGTADDDTTVTAASGTGAAIDATHLKATFHVTSDGTVAGSDAKDVVFYIKLADDWSKSWQFVADASTKTSPAVDKKDGTNNNGLGYFYYRTPLDSGVTSAPLIDSVKLDSSMGSPNYLDMVYDLKVALDSAQVTKDQYGNETADAVAVGKASTDNWAAYALTKNAADDAHPETGNTRITGDGVDGTIDWITWSAPTP